MKIYINGSNHTLLENLPTVEHALQHYLSSAQRSSSFAVAVNQAFVSKQAYATTTLAEHDALDILFPIVGG